MLGVAHKFPVLGSIIPSASATCVVRCVDFPTDRPFVFADIPPISALGVGHDKHSLSLVRSADFSRAEYSPRRLITSAFQVCEHCIKAETDVTFDILEEYSSRIDDSDGMTDERPQVPRVFRPFPCPCC